MAEVVILGAGLTGISTAYHLEQKNFFDYQLFERDLTIGGLCGSVLQDGFTFDFTGHLLHINDAYFNTLIDTVVGKEHFNSIVRKSFIYSHNVYTKYPFQINMYGLPPAIIAECIEGFVTRPQTKKEPHSFYDWVLNNFGHGIAQHFFIPFQSKILSYDIKKVTATWTGRFVPKTTLQQMLLGSLSDIADEAIGYNSNFYYPKKGGIQFWVNKIADQLKKPIKTSYEVVAIDIKNKIIIFSNGHQQPYKQLITTIPLDILLTMLIEPADMQLKKQAKKLVCNSVVNFNLGIANRNISDKHWIYFPEGEYPFYRIGFPHNFSDYAVPAGCSSLYGELSYIKGNTGVDAALIDSIKKVKQLLHIDDAEIATEKIITISHAYVIYDHWREKNIDKILAQLKEHDIYSIGRYGQWKYSSMQEAVLDGKKVVDELIINPAKKDINRITQYNTQRVVK